MTATILDGELLASRIKAELTDRVARLRAEGREVGLGTILVGDDVPSARYVQLKHEDCAEVGIASHGTHLGSDATQAQLMEAVDRFNTDPAVSAFLVQVPLPDGFDEQRALFAVDPDKDADGLHPINLGKLLMGAPGVLPCTPRATTWSSSVAASPSDGRSRPCSHPSGRGATRRSPSCTPAFLTSATSSARRTW
jgi:methylenetetrahydrofolate dehydrogenase (NADP+)/methenyltetrahydrofolate cyclohydrolase